MRGGENKQPLGYTIIEVMIVLAISGVMFAIAAIFISGKQARTAFSTGSNELNAQLQAIITQVNDGQYSDVNFKCSADPITGAITITLPSPTDQQGSRYQCVFLGKMLQFNYANDQTQYAVFSMAGQRGTATVGSKASFNYSIPIITNDSSPHAIDLTDYKQVPQQLKVSSVKVYNNIGTLLPSTAIGFAQSEGQVGGSGGYLNGAQTTTLVYAYDPSNVPFSPDTNVVLTPVTGSAKICVTDGTRYALITLGDNVNNANQLSASLQVMSTC